jgi:hypothetical protein
MCNDQKSRGIGQGLAASATFIFLKWVVGNLKSFREHPPWGKFLKLIVGYYSLFAPIIGFLAPRGDHFLALGLSAKVF